MDELWQRYRTFWTPVLIGLGVFLVGVIAVHIASADPDTESLRLKQAQSKLKRMQMPSPKKATTLKERGEALSEDNVGWSRRLNQTGDEQDKGKTVIDAAAEQALRAAILRGAENDEASRPQAFKARFDDDDVAADKAWKRYNRLVTQHKEQLRSGDPNVAFSQLLSVVWTDLRIRANRADVEMDAEQLGFGAISSVSRATLPGRVLNLALVARVVDTAIRYGVESIDQVLVPSNIEAGSPGDFLVLWPVDMVLTGDSAALKHVVDLLTDPDNPIPLGPTVLRHPKRGANVGSGLVELAVRASSVIVRPDVDLNLDAEEDE